MCNLSNTTEQAVSVDAIVSIFRAGSVGNIDPPITRIDIREQMGDHALPLFALQDFYQGQGKMLANALFSSLPGGSIDALLCELMRRRSSMLRVLFSC